MLDGRESSRKAVIEGAKDPECNIEEQTTDQA